MQKARRVLLIPATIVSWLFVLLVGAGFYVRYCDPVKRIYRTDPIIADSSVPVCPGPMGISYETLIFNLTAFAAAFVVVLVATAMAPNKKRVVARKAFIIGLIAAAAMFVLAAAWWLLLSATVGGLIMLGLVEFWYRGERSEAPMEHDPQDR